MTMANYNPTYWYAVIMDADDTDWGTGSHNLEEAMQMARDMDAAGVLVVEEGLDPVAVDYYKVEG